MGVSGKTVETERQRRRVMSTEEVRQKFGNNQEGAKEAFEEVASKLDHLLSNNEVVRDRMRARMELMKTANLHQREKLHRLRGKYLALMEKYNELAEEAKDRSDSSSSDEDEADDDENCSIM